MYALVANEKQDITMACDDELVLLVQNDELWNSMINCRLLDKLVERSFIYRQVQLDRLMEYVA